MTTQTRSVIWWYAAIILVPVFWYALAAAVYYSGLEQYGRYIFLPTVPVGLILIGMGFYAVRRVHRIFYGSVEILAGIVLAFYAISPALNLGAREVVTLAAAFYVIVRGLDNIGEGLKTYPKVNARWEAIFPKQQHGRA
jgi:hypothetical protein